MSTKCSNTEQDKHNCYVKSKIHYPGGNAGGDCSYFNGI